MTSSTGLLHACSSFRLRLFLSSCYTLTHPKTFYLSTNLVNKRCISSTRMAAIQPSSLLTHTIKISPTGGNVEIVAAPGLTDLEFRTAIESSLFKQWLKNLQSERGILAQGDMSLTRVFIQGVDMFGTRIGFLKFKAEVLDNETGNKIPGIVFARGPAVAVLIILETGVETYVILTEQARVPVGRVILELPAGMLDDAKGDVVGTAVREVEEETGIKLNMANMVDLTGFLDPSTGCKIFPSPGGCDEELSLFLYRAQVDKDVITALHGKETGLRDHGELIKMASLRDAEILKDQEVVRLKLWLEERNNELVVMKERLCVAKEEVMVLTEQYDQKNLDNQHLFVRIVDLECLYGSVEADHVVVERERER